jgi:acyl carrier protein
MMSATYRSVQTILRKQLLVPVTRIQSKQKFISDLGLSSFELNALLYYVEEKYKVRILETGEPLTVQELIHTIEQKNTDHTKR